MSSPVLDGARIVQDKTWRYDLTALVPVSGTPAAEAPRLGADGEELEVSDREKWSRLGQANVFGAAAHHGFNGGRTQIDLYVSSNSMLGFGGKLRLADDGLLALALGAQAHFTFFALLFKDNDEEDEKNGEGFPTITKLSVPLWLGLEPDRWLSIYLNVRPQLWWVEPVGVTGVLAQTVGLRFGTQLGLIAEATYAYEPFYGSGGVQAGFAFYFNTEPPSSRLPWKRTK